MFDFKDDRVTVVVVWRHDVLTCYHLSKGRLHWFLRRHGTATSYQPGLMDLPGDSEVTAELDLDEVEQKTGFPAKAISVRREPDKWDQILASLEASIGAGAGGGIGGGVGLGGNVPPDQPQQPRNHGVWEERIPFTDIRHLYMVLKDFNSAEFHLAMAREAERAPVLQRLGQRFRTSVEQFEAFPMTNEPFHPPRPDLPNRGHLERIRDAEDLTSLLVHELQAQQTPVNVVNDRELSFLYLDREINPARIQGGVLHWGGQPAIAGKRLDWLLANAIDHRPIVAEVKVGNDMNPFYALIQALMYTAELVTFNQATRLSHHYPQIQFPRLNDPDVDTVPSVDISLVLSNFNWRSPVRTQIMEVTERLCQTLMADPAVTPHVSQIACLDADLDDGGQLRFTKLFSYRGP